MKYLLLFAFLGVIWWVWKKRNAPLAEQSKPAPAPEQMLVCAHCGVYLPAGEAIVAEGRSYCCESHRKAAGH